MNFNDYQKQAKMTALYMEGILEKYKDLPYDIIKILGLTYTGLGLGETGEVQGKIKKIIRDSQGNITEEHKKAIKKELGDILWYIANMCSELNIELNDVAELNIEKLYSRKERGVLKGSGDDR